MSANEQPDGDVLPASLASDLAVGLLVTILETNAGPRESSRADAPACRSCGRGDAVITTACHEAMRQSSATCVRGVRRILRAQRWKPAKIRTIGDVQLFNLLHPASARLWRIF